MQMHYINKFFNIRSTFLTLLLCTAAVFVFMFCSVSGFGMLTVLLVSINYGLFNVHDTCPLLFFLCMGTVDISVYISNIISSVHIF